MTSLSPPTSWLDRVVDDWVVRDRDPTEPAVSRNGVKERAFVAATGCLLAGVGGGLAVGLGLDPLIPPVVPVSEIGGMVGAIYGYLYGFREVTDRINEHIDMTTGEES